MVEGTMAKGTGISGYFNCRLIYDHKIIGME